MSSQTFNYFQYVIMIQLVFAFSMTIIVYALPEDAINYASEFDTEHSLALDEVSQDLESGLTRQTNLPMLDLGALVFYSGNIVIDLMIRFFFAIPEMISIILGSVFMFIGIDAFIAAQLQLLIWAIVSAFYMLAIIKFVMNIRSQGAIV